MKLFKFLAASAAMLAFASSSFADVTLKFTGSTAFRAAAHSAMRDMLTFGGGQGFAFDGTTLTGANNSIFKGTIAGNPGLGVVTIKCSWSGSTGGIQTLTSGLTRPFYADSTPISAGGTASTPSSNLTDITIADITMMDTQQSTTAFQSPALTDEVVGVLPFVWVASKDAPAGLTNMTAQLARQLYAAGFMSSSAFTNNNADAPVNIDGSMNAAGTTVYAAGRDNSSGTRTYALTETGIGPNAQVLQVLTQGSIRVSTTASSTTLNVLAADQGSVSLNMIGKPITGGSIPASTTITGVTGPTIVISNATTATAASVTTAIGSTIASGSTTALYYTQDTGNGGHSSGGTLSDMLRVTTTNIDDAFSNQSAFNYSPKGCMVAYLGLSDADRAVNGTGSSVAVGTNVGCRYLSYEGVSCMGGTARTLVIGSQGVGATTLTTASTTTGIIVGQLVSGTGIAPGTTVTAVTATTIDLSEATTNGTSLTNNSVKVQQFLPNAVRNGAYPYWAYQRIGYLPSLLSDSNKAAAKTAFFNKLTGSSTDLGATSAIPDNDDMRFTRSVDGGPISQKF